MTKGFLDLTNSSDLFRKLEWEFERLSENPTNSYLAYNFFVTAWHLLEWKYPDPEGREIRKDIRDRTLVLQICEHLAVGAKHFAPTNDKHESIAGSAHEGGIFGDSWGRSWGNSLGGQLAIKLDGEAATVYGPRIVPQDLAGHVMQFWRDHFASHG